MSATNYVIEGVRRVSSLGGRIVSADSTMTLTDQEANLQNAVETMATLTGKPYRLGRIVDAVDESGFTFAAGDTMAEVLSRVEAGESGGVAFAYFDRNGRNWWDQGPFFKRLETAGGEYVVRGMESIDYRTQVGRQLFGSMAVASEGVYFAAKDRGDSIVEKIMDRKVPNRVPYGYQRNGTFVDGKLAQKIDADRDAKALVPTDTSAVVRRIYAMKLAGYGIGPIVTALNADEIPGPTGGTWAKSTVSSLIANPIYMGTITMGRLTGKKGNRRKGTNIRTTHDPAIAIVSEHDWQRAQSTRKVQRTGTYKAGVAGGVLKCGSCGGTLSVIGTGEGRRLYGCRRGTTKVTCPKPVHVTKHVADEYVDGLVVDVLTGKVRIKHVDATKLVADAKKKLDAAVFEADNLMDKVPPSHPRFAHFLQQTTDAVDDAQAEYDDAVALAGRRSNFPDADTYMGWSDERRNGVARDLLRVVVSPPLSRSKFATITDRFTPEFE